METDRTTENGEEKIAKSDTESRKSPPAFLAVKYTVPPNSSANRLFGGMLSRSK